MSSSRTVLEEEARARHPSLLPIANISLLLTGALMIVCAVFSFGMSMNAKERAARESVGTYREATFVVARAYWRRQRSGYGGMRGSGSEIARAQGTIDGASEWMDLMPYFARGNQSQAVIDRLFPVGASIHVYYNPQATGDDRVRFFWGGTPPLVSATHEAQVTAKFGLVSSLLFAVGLFLSIRFRRYCIGPIQPSSDTEQS